MFVLLLLNTTATHHITYMNSAIIDVYIIIIVKLYNTFLGTTILIQWKITNNDYVLKVN